MLTIIISVIAVSSIIYIVNYEQPSTSAEKVEIPFRGGIHGNYDPDKYIDRFKMPRYIPEGYKIYDSTIQETHMALWYTPNGEDASMRDGMIQYFTAIDDGDYYSSIISNGTKFLEEYKAKSQRGELMTIFKIDGKPAMMWDSGTKNNIFMYTNGTVTDVEEITYPATVWMIDTENRAFYSVKGYVAIGELIKIIKSVN
jgi:hypothetical protein